MPDSAQPAAQQVADSWANSGDQGPSDTATSTPTSTPTPTPACAPQEATAETEEECPDQFWGWRWNGETCVGVYGCQCEGEDCEVVSTQRSWAVCMGRHKPCCPGISIPFGTPTSSQPTSPATSPSVLGGAAQVGDQGPGDTATPTATATPTPTDPCQCWPQDIEVVTPEGSATPTCPDPDETHYRHVGYGVCEAVTGCLKGSDADEAFDSMDACLTANEDCVCINCDPLPTPIPIPSPTFVPACDHCSPGTKYLDWREWYPMDRGQKPGERALNWWTQAGAACLRGQSTYNYDGIPKGFPVEYAGQCLDYYFNWGCQRDDPDCNDYERRMEIITERRNPDGSATYLDLWGAGEIDRWQVYFDPNQLGDGSACACNEETISALSAEQRKAKRVPSSFLSPCRVGDWAYGNVACAATFTKGTGDGTRGWDEAHLGIPGSKEDPVSLWVTRTMVQEFLQDADQDCNIALLVNEYLSTSCAQVEEECSQVIPTPTPGPGTPTPGPGTPTPPSPHEGDPRCEMGEDGKMRARHFTFVDGSLSIGAVPPLPTAGTETPAPTALPCEGCDLKWCMVMREEYYVRQVPRHNPLTGGEYELAGGFGGFDWAGRPGCAGDDCPYWYIDRLEGVVGTPTPGSTPTPGPTSTPVTIEDDLWRTRCRHPGNCGVGGANTPTVTPVTGFCGKPTNTPVPATSTAGDRLCGQGYGTPGSTQTPQPTRTAPTPLTPFPTSGSRTGVRFPTDSAPTCVPSSTPTPTATNTSSPTSTPTYTSTPIPTATFTPTSTATSLPSCDTVTAQRGCPTPAANCLHGGSGCTWTIAALNFADLECDGDESPSYDVDLSVTECSNAQSLSQVTAIIQTTTGNHGPFYLQGVGGSSPKIWALAEADSCVPGKPSAILIRWWTYSASPAVLGMASASVTICCVEACE